MRTGGKRIMKNEKKLVSACAYALMLVLLAGCTTTNGLSGKDAELVAANSRNVGRIEGTVGVLAGTVERSKERLEIISRAGQRIADAGDRLEYLFGEYEQEVERLLGEIDRLKAQLEEMEDGGGR